jgi:sulfur relay (sulfurtransferase) DsrC/TusE family protein
MNRTWISPDEAGEEDSIHTDHHGWIEYQDDWQSTVPADLARNRAKFVLV